MVSIYTGFLACVLTFELRRALSASPFQRLVSHQLSYLARSWHWHIKRLSIPCGGQPESQFGADYLRKKHLSQKISELRCIESNQTIGINEIIPDIKPIHATYLIIAATVKWESRIIGPPVNKEGKPIS